MLLPQTTTYSEFRENLSSHLKRLKKTDRPTLITQNGKTAAVVMAPDVYERLVSDAEEARSIARLRHSHMQARQGKLRPVDEVFANLYQRVAQPSPRKRSSRSKSDRR